MAEKKERKYVATENAGKAAVKTTKEERRQKNNVKSLVRRESNEGFFMLNH